VETNSGGQVMPDMQLQAVICLCWCNSQHCCSSAQICKMDVPRHALPCWANCPVLCCAVLCCAVLCCAVLCCAVTCQWMSCCEASRLAQSEYQFCLLPYVSTLDESPAAHLAAGFGNPPSQQWHQQHHGSCGPRSAGGSSLHVSST